MFDIGWTELLVVAAIAIIVVGPKDLPRMLRTFGQTVGKLRRMANEFQSTFNDAVREAEKQADIDEMRKSVEAVGNFDPLGDIKKAVEPVKKAGDDLAKDVGKPIDLEEPATGRGNATESASQSGSAPDAKAEAPGAEPEAKPATPEKPAAAAKADASTKVVEEKAPSGSDTKVTATKPAPAKTGSTKSRSTRSASAKTTSKSPPATSGTARPSASKSTSAKSATSSSSRSKSSASGKSASKTPAKKSPTGTTRTRTTKAKSTAANTPAGDTSDAGSTS